MFPPIPPWEGIHPLLVHFPIALLIVVPVFLFVSLFRSSHTQCFSMAALLTMVLGVAGAFVAVLSGAAGAGLVWENVSPEIQQAIHKHAEIAEWARTVYAILTLVYAAILLAPLLLKKPVPRRVDLTAQIAFLVVWTGCLLILFKAAHLGGLLVHQHGVRALLVRY